MLVVPAYFVLSTVLVIIGGLTYFQEYTAFHSVGAAVAFGCGVLLTLAGVFVVALFGAGRADSSDDTAIDSLSVNDEVQAPTFDTTAPLCAAVTPVLANRPAPIRRPSRLRSGDSFGNVSPLSVDSAGPLSVFTWLASPVSSLSPRTGESAALLRSHSTASRSTCAIRELPDSAQRLRYLAVACIVVTFCVC